MGETATFIKPNFVGLMFRIGGFAPRHLSRWAASLGKTVSSNLSLK
jgi:hypothetical protein